MLGHFYVALHSAFQPVSARYVPYPGFLLEESYGHSQQCNANKWLQPRHLGNRLVASLKRQTNKLHGTETSPLLMTRRGCKLVYMLLLLILIT